MQLRELKVIVTGAAQGMGAHFARRLAEAGAQVAAGEVAPMELGPGIHRRKLDVSSEADCEAFVAWAGANPDQMSTKPIDGLWRAMAETYPCPK